MTAELSPKSWVLLEKFVLRQVLFDYSYHKLYLVPMASDKEQIINGLDSELSRRSDADFRALVDISPFPVVLHAEGVILYANTLVASLVKRNHIDQLIGHHLDEFIHPEDHTKLHQAILAHTHDGVLPTVMSFRFMDMDGTPRHAQFRSAQIQYQGRKCRFVYGYNFDKAEQANNALQERDQLLHKLTEIIPDHLLVINSLTRNKLFENKPIMERLGYDTTDFAEIGEMNFLISKVHPDDMFKIESARRFMSDPRHAGEFASTEYRILDKSGKWRWLLSRSSQLSPAQDGIGAVNFGIIQDITEVKEKEAEVLNYQKFLENVYKASPVLITILELGTNIPIYRSFDFGHWFGYESASGKTLIDIIHPDYKNDLLAAIGRMPHLVDGEILSTLFPFTKGDNSSRYLLSRTTVFERDAQGRVTQVLIAHSDVTDLKEVESKLDKSEVTRKSILHAIPDTVFAVNTVGMIVDFYPNEDQEAILASDTLTGRSILDIMPASLHQPVIHGIQSTIATQKIHTLEYEEIEDGVQSYFELRLSPLSDSEIIIIVRDISDIKLSQRKLDHYNSELVEKNQELERYITSNSELEKFAYIASHDLREPLRSMIGFAQLLQKRNEGHLSTESVEFIDSIIMGAQRMNTLVNGLLEYSRVSNTGKPFVHVDTADLLLKVQSDLSTSIEENEVELICTDMPQLYCDELQIRQLFQNLISNSIKFRTAAPPLIRITATLTDTSWIFMIADNGIGMDMKYREKVFQIFTRLHAQERYQGSGIGLSVCKKIVERHGGSIWIESEEGRGTEIYFSIPIA
jgi:PAS domain S-box-containing protein